MTKITIQASKQENKFIALTYIKKKNIGVLSLFSCF